MTHRKFVLVAFAWSAAGIAACGDDTVALLPQDAGADQSVLSDATAEASHPVDGGMPTDSTAPQDAADAATPPTRLLLTYNGETQSEVVAFGLQSGAVDGRLTFNDYIGGGYVGPTAPWVLEQSTDIVGRLDSFSPWTLDSTWNVALNDLTDAGYAQPNAEPMGVIANIGSSGPQAYVLRYNRNLIAVIDPTQNVDGGGTTGTIDLSSEVQSGSDDYVQAVAGVYVASQQRVYVILGNIDRFDVVDDGYDLLCSSSTPTVIAIDTTSNTLIDLNGSAPGNGWPLVGYSPVFGPGALAFDSMTGTDGRLLVLLAGCYDATSDGGPGALTKREVDSLDLSTGTATKLLDLTSGAFPTSLTYIDPTHAIVQLDTAYTWDPTTTTLGPAIANAPDAFVYDGQGHLLGISGEYGADGGVTGYEVLSVAVADGGVTQLGTNPFVLTGGYLGSAVLWPAP